MGSLRGFHNYRGTKLFFNVWLELRQFKYPHRAYNSAEKGIVVSYVSDTLNIKKEWSIKGGTIYVLCDVCFVIIGGFSSVSRIVVGGCLWEDDWQKLKESKLTIKPVAVALIVAVKFCLRDFTSIMCIAWEITKIRMKQQDLMRILLETCCQHVAPAINLTLRTAKAVGFLLPPPLRWRIPEGIVTTYTVSTS